MLAGGVLITAVAALALHLRTFLSWRYKQTMIGRPPSQSGSESSDEQEQEQEQEETSNASEGDEEDMLLPGLDNLGPHAGSNSTASMSLRDGRRGRNQRASTITSSSSNSMADALQAGHVTDGPVDLVVATHMPSSGETPDLGFYETWRHGCLEDDGATPRWRPRR
jgi:hypothetical protein